MSTRLLAPCLIALLGVTVTYADETTTTAQSPSSELGFLESGRDYIIRFSDDSQLFKKTQSGITSTSYTTEDGKKHPGKPAAWTFTVSVDIFHVVKFGGGSWVLLEHPSSQDDFAKWMGKRRAMAQLTDQRIAQLEADPDGEETLQNLREAASRELRTAKTWVNLDHAVAITDVPVEPVELKFSVQSVEIKDTK